MRAPHLNEILYFRIPPFVAPKFRRLFDGHVFEFVWPLTDVCHWKAETYREKTEMKFARMKTSPWQTWVPGLADRLNNSLCFYTQPYIENTQPTARMKMGVSIYY